jgi:hypothetical protein
MNDGCLKEDKIITSDTPNVGLSDMLLTELKLYVTA